MRSGNSNVRACWVSHRIDYVQCLENPVEPLNGRHLNLRAHRHVTSACIAHRFPRGKVGLSRRAHDKKLSFRLAGEWIKWHALRVDSQDVDKAVSESNARFSGYSKKQRTQFGDNARRLSAIADTLEKMAADFRRMATKDPKPSPAFPIRFRLPLNSPPSGSAETR